MRMESFMSNAVPFVIMVLLESGDVVMSSLAKAVMARGISQLVFSVYSTASGALVLLPCFIFHSYRTKRPPITFSLLCRFFILGLLGMSLVSILGYTGINYSSPTLAAAIGNLIPAFTFLLAIIFRMEKLDLRHSTGQAKILGTIVSISGAFVVILFKGPAILTASSPSNLPHPLLSQKSNWVVGGIFITVASLSVAIWNIFQAATVKVYPDKMTVVFFYSFFGAVQSAVFAFTAERNPRAWRLHPDIELFAVLFSAVYSIAIRSNILTWCLQKKGPVYVSLFRPLGIVIAVVIGVIFLDEVLHLGSVIGAIVLAVGFYAVMWGLAKGENMPSNNVCSSESSTVKTPLMENMTEEI